MTKRGHFAAATLLTVLAASLTNPRRALAQPQKMTPFAADSVRTDYTASGAVRGQPEDYTYYRREDGSYYYRNWSEGSTHGLVAIIDAGRHDYAILEEQSRLKITFRYSPERFERAMNPRQEGVCPEPGGQVELLGNAGERFGLQVIRVRARSEKSTREELLAPELKCFSIESVETYSTGDKTVEEVTSLKLGPPPDSMFEVPSDYVERSPAAMEQEYKARFGRPFWGDDWSRIMENNYWKLKTLQDSPR